MSRVFPVLAIVGLLGAGAVRPAVAQMEEPQLKAYGVRIGASLDNDLTQLLIGGQADLGRLATNLRFQPFLTLGVGDNALSLVVAGEAHYLFPVASDASVLPYAGGGIGLSYVNFDEPQDDDTQAVLTVVGGIDVPRARWWGWFAEGRFLIADQSIFRLEGGINWKY